MRPAVGATYFLKESDYRFGTGQILVTVTNIVEQTEYNGEPWWTIQGQVRTAIPDYLGGWEFREFLQVREANLHRERIRPRPTA
jgi:hypothetical protein